MPGDVIKQLKERKSFEEEDENSHHQSKVIEEAAQEIDVEQVWKAAAGGDSGFLLCTIPVGHSGGENSRGACPGSAAAAHAYPPPDPANWAQPAALPAELFHAREQDHPQYGKEGVGNPDSGCRRECALARQASSRDENQVVGRNEQHGDERPRRPATTPGLRTKRNSHQSKRKASRGKRKTTGKFDARFAPPAGV